MKRISQLTVVLFCIVTTLFFSCKNKENKSTNTDENNYNESSADTTSENSEPAYDTTAVQKDTVNGTTPTGSNDRGQ